MSVDKSLRGKRVEVIELGSKKPRLPKGSQGTIRHVDEFGTVHVDWDEECWLGLIPDYDKYKILE